jgi:AraC family transcriptional regulator of adaptative response / DNA-3-methyladenine glycosylase II
MKSTRRRRGEDGDETAVALQLDVLLPYDWDHLLGFLATHAIPGVERVKDGRYQHTFGDGRVTVARESETALRVTVAPALRHAEDGAALLQRLRALFDVDAHPQSIAARLALDARLAASLAQRPGMRVPGAFDGFELAVRTILGQQVSVRGGSTLSGRFVAAYGKKLAAAVAAGEAHPLTHLFPTPKRIAKLDPEAVAKVVGMPIPRGRAIVALARGMVDGTVDPSPGSDPLALDAALLALPGVGPWTSAYIVMRAARSADAFPAGDLVLKKRLGADTAKQVMAWAEPLRPFRSYAAMHLWASP